MIITNTLKLKIPHEYFMSDTSTVNFFTDKFPKPSQILEDIEKDGYKIYSGAINKEVYDKLRKFWLEYFSTSNNYYDLNQQRVKEFLK